MRRRRLGSGLAPRARWCGGRRRGCGPGRLSRACLRGKRRSRKAAGPRPSSSSSSSRARRLQPPSSPRHLERGTEPCPAPTEPRSWPPAPTPSGPNFPLSVVSSRTPLRYLLPTPTCSPAGPVPLNPNLYLPPQLFPSVPLRFSLVVCLSLAFMRLCQTYNGNIVEFLEPVSGYGNTLHNAFGDEPDNFPYAFSHPSLRLFAGSRYCCPISQMGNIQWTVWREHWLRNQASAVVQVFCNSVPSPRL